MPFCAAFQLVWLVCALCLTMEHSSLNLSSKQPKKTFHYWLWWLVWLKIFSIWDICEKWFIWKNNSLEWLMARQWTWSTAFPWIFSYDRWLIDNVCLVHLKCNLYFKCLVMYQLIPLLSTSWLQHDFVRHDFCFNSENIDCIFSPLIYSCATLLT
jgi:hypothetical protein